MATLRLVPKSRMKKAQTSPPYTPYYKKGDRASKDDVEDKGQYQSGSSDEVESRFIFSLVEEKDAHGYQSEEGRMRYPI